MRNNSSNRSQGIQLKSALFVNHQYSDRHANFGGGQRWQHDMFSCLGSKVGSGAVGDYISVQVAGQPLAHRCHQGL